MQNDEFDAHLDSDTIHDTNCKTTPSVSEASGKLENKIEVKVNFEDQEDDPAGPVD